MILIPLVFAISFTTKGDLLRSFLFALSVGLGLIPEMLPMVVNACLAHGSAVMGKKQTIVKNIDAMQSFANLDVLCVDKTGTLTEDKILLEYFDVTFQEIFDVQVPFTRESLQGRMKACRGVGASIGELKVKK